MARSTQPFKRLRHDAEVVDLTLDDDDAPARSHGSSAKMEGLGMRSMEARPKRQPPQERSTRNNPINLISPEPEDRHRTRSDVVMSDAPVPETRRERRGKPAQSDDTREKTTPKKAEAWRPWTPEKAEASVPSNLVENGKPRRGNATNDATMNDFSRRRRVNQLEDDSRVLDATAGAADVNRQPQALPKKTKTPPAPPIQFDPLPEITFQPVPKKQVKKFTDWTAPNVPLEYGAIAELWEKFQEEFKEDHARFACDKLERARMQNQEAEAAYQKAHQELDAKVAASVDKPTSNWWDDPPVSTPATGQPKDNQFTFTNKLCVKGSSATQLHVSMTPFTPKAVNVPHFRTYYPIRRSQLVQSDRDLLFWPEATENDNLSEDDIKNELKGQFHFRMLQRVVEVSYTQIGRQWQPYAEAFLEELGLSEVDVLRFLLDETWDAAFTEDLANIKCKPKEVKPKDLLKQTRKELKRAPQLKAIRERVREWNASEMGFDDLKREKFRYLALAFYAISSSYRYSNKASCFNVVYCLMASPSLDIAAFLRDPKETVEVAEYTAKTHFDLACRICHVYPCFVHGLDSMWDYRPPDPPDLSDDEDDDPSIEEELCPLFDTLTNLHRRELGRKSVQAAKPAAERAKADTEFSEYSLYGDPNAQSKTRVFFPCNHQGPCEAGVCHCLPDYCEKSCGCDSTCKHRFKGCKCARRGKVCSEESKCPCLKADRECDPDLCGSCGVYDALDPQNRDQDAAFFKDKCQNCQIQRNVPKRTLIGESTVHGIGLFAGEDIKKGEYIGEYLGAKLNWKQAERSGLYLLLNGYSYLFDMTGDQTVDSMVLGNKTRFVNSIPNKWNCAPKVFSCNTEHRMALYAIKDIVAGDELSFNYGDPFFDNHKKQAVRKAEKEKGAKAVGVKKYKRAPYGKRGKYKKKGRAVMEDAVPAVRLDKPKVSRRVLKDVRSVGEENLSIRRMVDAMQQGESNATDEVSEEDENGDEGHDPMELDEEEEVDQRVSDSEEDSMDEDYEANPSDDEDEDQPPQLEVGGVARSMTKSQPCLILRLIPATRQAHVEWLISEDDAALNGAVKFPRSMSGKKYMRGGQTLVWPTNDLQVWEEGAELVCWTHRLEQIRGGYDIRSM